MTFAIYAMAPSIQWREPEQFTAGDTLNFERNLPDYPASEGWALDYELRGQSQPISFQSTADVNNHKISVASATTNTWVPGQYVMAGYAIKSSTGERHQIYYGVFQLYENKQTAPGDAPELTFAQQMIAQLEIALLAKAGNDLAQSKLGESEFKYMTHEQIRAEHGYWTAVRRNEIAKINAKNGRPTGLKIRPRVNAMQSGPVFGSQWPNGFGYGGW